MPKKNKSVTVYKVVRDVGGKLMSAMNYPEVELEYVVGRKTAPRIRGSKLFAFRSLGIANWFASEAAVRNDCVTRVFAADAQGVTSRNFSLCGRSRSLTRNEVRQFWSRKLRGTRSINDFAACSSLTLLEEIK